jgi:hypothetical protein
VSSAPVCPPNIHSTAGAHFRSLLGSGTAIVGGAIAAAIVFSIGAADHRSVPLMVGGPIVVALIVVVWAWRKATNDAENEFFNRWAASHALHHWPKWSIPEYTPLLGGGDRRHCDHFMEANGRGIGWFTYEVRHDNGDNPDTYDPYEFTIATVDVGEHGMGRFQGIYLRRRRGMLEKLSTEANWLKNERLKKVELESTAFCDRYELWRREDQDEIVLHQLFAPSFVIWLANHPLSPGFELRAGMLVVFIPGHCGEAGRLEFLLMAANEISRRVQAELTEAAQAGSV